MNNCGNHSRVELDLAISGMNFELSQLEERPTLLNGTDNILLEGFNHRIQGLLNQSSSEPLCPCM